MPCPTPVHLNTTETDRAILAAFEGPLGRPAVPLLVHLADRMREARKPARLDLTRTASIDEAGCAGLAALERAATDVGVTFQVTASGNNAAELLAQAGLAGMLYRGP